MERKAEGKDHGNVNEVLLVATLDVELKVRMNEVREDFRTI